VTDSAAIKATFSDFQLVKTRKLAKLIFEVPIEEADKALDVLGGVPRSDRERWVGITLLDLQVVATVFDEVTHLAFCDLPFPQQAGIKSNDTTFQLWMSVHYNHCDINYDCADAIRAHCGVRSRADILPGTSAGDKWIELLREFENYR